MFEEYIRQEVSVENRYVKMLEEHYRVKTLKHHDGSMVEQFQTTECAWEQSDEKNIWT
jgi:hypothetical protein